MKETNFKMRTKSFSNFLVQREPPALASQVIGTIGTGMTRHHLTLWKIMNSIELGNHQR